MEDNEDIELVFRDRDSGEEIEGFDEDPVVISGALFSTLENLANEQNISLDELISNAIKKAVEGPALN